MDRVRSTFSMFKGCVTLPKPNIYIYIYHLGLSCCRLSCPLHKIASFFLLVHSVLKVDILTKSNNPVIVGQP